MVPSLLCTFVVAHITFLYVFFLHPPFILSSLSLSCFLFLSLSLFLFLSLFISSPSFSLWLQDTCHLMPFTKYSLLDQPYFFTPYLSIAHIKFTNYSPTIFYDCHPQSCLKNIFFALGPFLRRFSDQWVASVAQSKGRGRRRRRRRRSGRRGGWRGHEERVRAMSGSGRTGATWSVLRWTGGLLCGYMSYNIQLCRLGIKLSWLA